MSVRQFNENLSLDSCHEHSNNNETHRALSIADFYYRNHINQTISLVKDRRQKYDTLTNPMTIWEAISLCDKIIDQSDPDTQKSQTIHLFQTAESLRSKYPDKDWLHLTGLIHDLGKVLIALYDEPDHLVVGDTFPVGCRFSDKIVYSKFFKTNPDSSNDLYNSKYGIYKPHLGFDNVLMSWGHDEYMYRVCVQSECKLPPEALYIIRYHSFYSQHQENAYDHLANEYDHKMMEHVKVFQKCDLYSKIGSDPNIDALRPYYVELVDKYFPNIIKW